MNGEIEINAAGKSLGRMATEIANILNGKDSPAYAPNKVGENKVKVINASKIQLTDKKKKQKIYLRYTGYFGGLRKLRMEELIAKKGTKEVVKNAVYGMLADNRLRKVKMANLTVEE